MFHSRVLGDRIKGHKRRVDTNRLVSETHCWILQMFIYSMKKKKKSKKDSRQISTVNHDRYSLNTDNLG